MYYEDLVLEAMGTVSAWNVPEECFAQAVAQRLQMDPAPDIYFDFPVDNPYAHLSTETLQDAANSIGTYLDKALEKKS